MRCLSYLISYATNVSSWVKLRTIYISYSQEDNLLLRSISVRTLEAMSLQRIHKNVDRNTKEWYPWKRIEMSYEGLTWERLIIRRVNMRRFTIKLWSIMTRRVKTISIMIRRILTMKMRSFKEESWPWEGSWWEKSFAYEKHPSKRKQKRIIVHTILRNESSQVKELRSRTTW